MKILFILVLTSFGLLAQSWSEKIDDPTNFYSIRKAYLEGKELQPKQTVIQNPEVEDSDNQFRRWEFMLEPRVYPSGKLPPSGYLLDEYNKFFSSQMEFDTLRKGNWRSIEYDEGFPDGGFSGRLNCIAFHPSDTNIMYVGSPSGGLWKTTNGGSYWNPLTDNLPSLGVSEILIDYVNPDIMYMATGDRDGANFISNPYSYGLLKSTDAGKTWSGTGLNYIFEDQMTIQRVIMHPKNPNILLAAITGTNGNYRGIWRTTDGGVTWKNVSGGGKFDVEFNPADPNIVYCSGWKYLAKSTNGGADWAVINSTILPSADITSSKISVTPANPHIVVVQYLNPANGFTYGLYKSWDDGNSWTKINSEAISTQAAYDWVLAVSPNDTNIVLWGGQQLFGSVNAGGSSTYYPSGHVDHHELVYRPGSNVLYNCNDGGLYKSYTNGLSWINLNKSLYTFQYYRLSTSATNKDFVITGAQDNGTQKHNLPRWIMIGPLADGMESIIDYNDANRYYISYQYGVITRYGNGIGSFTIPPTAGNSATCAWVTPYIMHPKNSAILFFGAKEIYKTTNYGNIWTAMSNQLTAQDGVGGGMIRSMSVSESNPDSVLYAASYVIVYKTTDAGTTWKNITGTLPTSAGVFTGSAISSICVHPDKPETVWVTMSGYSKSNKVFKTTNGGITWENISANLPAIPINCIVYQKWNNDAIYIGTDFGVFYRDSTMDKWIPYMNNLPNVPVMELEIHYGTEKLRAATFGRGLWESNLYGKVLNYAENENSETISIFPNPAKDYISFSIINRRVNPAVDKVEIYSIEGILMQSTSPQPSPFSERAIQLRLDVSSLVPGVYFVKIGDVVQRFVKI